MTRLPFDPTKPLYKFSHRKHLKALQERGGLRIGTLYDFRRVELGRAIGDVTEGTATGSQALAGTLRVPGTEVVFKNSVAVRSEDTPDCYVFCMSDQPTPEAQAEFGYDACLQIRDLERFADLLTRALQNAVASKGLIVGAPTIRRCNYGSRDRTLDEAERTPPAFLKEEVFSYQHEVRMVWSVEGGPIKPLCVECPEVVDLLEDFTVPIPADFKKLESPHAPKLSNDELLRRTYAVVEKLAELLIDVKQAEDEALRKSQADDPVSRGEAFLRPREVLKQRLLADGVVAELEALVLEYTLRGNRDARVERALAGGPATAFHPYYLAAGLQRLSELFEINLARAGKRPMLLASASSYRFWHSSSKANPSRGQIGAAILEARAAEREIPVISSLDSPPRGSWYELALSPPERDALVWLVEKSGVPPSEVIDDLLRQRY